MATSFVKQFTFVNRTRFLALHDSCSKFAPVSSTPMMDTFGAIRFTYAAIPAIKPPPPTGTKIASGHLPDIYMRNLRDATQRQDKISNLTQDFHTDSSVPGNHHRIIEWVYECSSFVSSDLDGMFLQLCSAPGPTSYKRQTIPSRLQSGDLAQQFRCDRSVEMKAIKIYTMRSLIGSCTNLYT